MLFRAVRLGFTLVLEGDNRDEQISNEEVDGCYFPGRFFGVGKQFASGKGRERLRVRATKSVSGRDLLSS